MTPQGFTSKTALINVNRRQSFFYSFSERCLIGRSFHGALLLIPEAFFFRVMLSFDRAYQMPSLETPKTSARSANVNRRQSFFYSFSERCLIGRSFHGALLLIPEAFFFRVMLSFDRAYQMPSLETPKTSARSARVLSGKSATCFSRAL